ncbi:nitrogenase molybdenum-cofactor synthesis protein NifE [Natronobacillus azotifigens]|uniref:Nitrogenase iron-molybdenum cofactor biosynthesis protein NifE n=1 Tax=Natronobacillus azotifigens TaxID=472978 RepID=A0A9J6REF8_9BACI|nr:nitrogenase iron-molybdenum cofactor biosynthesis protein NifE [Natronobacillus azotifigens]MCZ0703740.1 nitrogenase iron-molybdenum cofactor biosynthesis protein NifE [Natronobacillus azotifigens]
MKNHIINAFQEPACQHNQTQSNQQGCSPAKPGQSNGGCAFDGAQITLLPIADAAHLVHGPIACGGNSWERRGSLSSDSSLYRYGLTTDLSEQDIIFGGDEKLFRSIDEIIQRFHPPAIFVYSTCVTALIGVDLDSICHQAAKRHAIPIIPVNSPGFSGSKNLGNRLAGQALIDYVIGTKEPPFETPFDLNFIGEYNIAGEMWDIEDLLKQLGIRLLSRITGDSHFHEVQWAHRAKVNMVVCGRALINVARHMEDAYEIPYFEGSFYGAKQTSSSLMKIAKLFGDQRLIDNVSELIKNEEEKLEEALKEMRNVLRGKRALLYTGGVKSWSVISALQELEIEVVGVGISKSSQEDIARIKDLVGEDALLINSRGARVVLETFKEKQGDILIAGGRNIYVALKERIPFLEINQERDHAYAGYTGFIRMAQHLVNAIQHPVWRLANLEAPWEESNHDRIFQ